MKKRKKRKLLNLQKLPEVPDKKRDDACVKKKETSRQGGGNRLFLF